MFYMPITKAKVQLVLTAEIPLDSENDETHQEQLEKLLSKLSDNPHILNTFETKQEFVGELIQGDS